jgi:alpha-beta hydrolase superfamily lysophospholipase
MLPLLLLLAVVLATILGVRAFDAFRGPPLPPWLAMAPSDPDADAIDSMSWQDWLEAEDVLFSEVARDLARDLRPEDRIPQNRYWTGSPLNPARLPRDWNRSFTLAPSGPPRGAVVMVHGLTDSPYSMRHFARFHAEQGFYVIVPRVPGHGTVPGALTTPSLDQWQAMARLAMRKAKRQANGGPIHLIGYSNGAAIALRHALAALETPALVRPDRLVVVSPMIGLTPAARLSGIAGWPAVLPAFANAAWLDRTLEYNPFKYNSFPVHAAVLAERQTQALARDLARAREAGRLGQMPPVLAFQSVVDSTVIAAAVPRFLAQLPAGGHELVLFDVNHAGLASPLLTQAALGAAGRLVPGTAQPYGTTLVSNAGRADGSMVARSWAAGATRPTETAIGLAYPPSLFSLAHVALPFPLSDGLYGLDPDPADPQGAQLGRLFVHGETGAISVNQDTLTRASSNPFFPLMLERIGAALPG